MLAYLNVKVRFSNPVWKHRFGGPSDLCLNPNSATYLLAMWSWSLMMNDLMLLHGFKYLFVPLIPPYLSPIPVPLLKSRIINLNAYIPSLLECWLSISNLLIPYSQNKRHHYPLSQKSHVYSSVFAFSYPLIYISKCCETGPPNMSWLLLSIIIYSEPPSSRTETTRIAS